MYIYIYTYIYIYIYIHIYIYIYSVRGGEGGEGGGGETSPPDLGAHLWVHTEGTPPPPHNGNFAGWGSVGRGLRGGE